MISEYNRLHTNSSYASDLASSFNLRDLAHSQEGLLEADINRAYQNLLAKENSFYSAFGYHSAQEFYSGIRQIIKESEKDFKILNNFTSIKIREALNSFQTFENRVAEAGVINITFVNKDNIGDRIMEELKKIEGVNNIESINGNLSIGFEWNLKTLKSIVNKVNKKKFQKNSSQLKGVLDYLKENSDYIIMTKDGSNNLPPQKIDYRDSVFNYGKAEINKLDIKELTKIQKQIENFIGQKLQINQGSGLLQMVATKVMNNIISSNITNIDFFTESGSRWKEKVVGAMGEFRTAVFFEYLAIKCPNKNLAEKISEIIGNKTGTNNQEFHSDLQILESFGVQVKNYSSSHFSDGSERKVEVRLHPMEIAPLMKDEELVSYIINSYFNISLAPVQTFELKGFFEENALELLNLSLPTTVNIPAKVTFYLVGKSLIPGSEIIRNAFLTKKKIVTVSETTIQGKSGYTDFEYLEPKKSKDSDSPRFTDWWIYKNGSWNPTSKNELAAWDKLISIRTRFTYSAFWESGAFDIF